MTQKTVNILLGRENLRLKLKLRSLKLKLIEYSRRGSIKSICFLLNRAADEVKLDDNTVFKELLESTARNFHKKKQGKRYKSTVKEFYKEIMYWGGPRLASFVAANLLGPKFHSFYRWRNSKLVLLEGGITEQNFKVIEELYKETIGQIGCEKVPVELCEEETAIVKEVVYKQKSDELWGFCGVAGEDHQSLDNFVTFVGEGEAGYDAITTAFQNYEIDSYARALILNPLHKMLPKIPVFIMPTCNRFKHRMVYQQWEQIKRFYDSNLLEIMGPLIGNSFDGDSRRRKLFVQIMSSLESHQFRPIPIILGFIFSCPMFITDASYKIYHLMDSDYIHNHKKLTNHLDHASRILRIGQYVITINHLRQVYEDFPAKVHGITRGDIDRDD